MNIRIRLPHCFIFLAFILQLTHGLFTGWCYECFSSESGCGENLDVRLQHWRRCGNALVPNNYCVKIEQKVGGQRYLTRGCLDTLMRSTEHRLDIPRVRRHGYCVNAVSYQDKIRKKGVQSLSGEYKRYCFCDDWNGCNTAASVTLNTWHLGILCILSVLRYVYQ